MRSECGAAAAERARGMSLIELLIAMAVVSVAMLGIVGMLPAAHQQLRVGGGVTRATALAQRILELLRDEPVDLLPRYHQADTRTVGSFPVDDPGADPPFRGGSSFQQWHEEIALAGTTGGLPLGWGRIEIEPLDRRLLSVMVEVGWQERAVTRAVELRASVGQE
jgi:prepilin-type N-terminal cleavage/methylation domain-containing protein